MFAGFKDYIQFNPLSLNKDASQPNIAITSWKINNKPSDYTDEGSPLHQSINSLNTVQLNYDQNFLTFEFAALQFNQPETFEYRYKLSGLDKNWIYAGNSNLINYTALPPGNYTLSINSTNTSGLWSNKIKKLRIIIHPPWWKTWWFYALEIMLAFTVIYIIYSYRLRQALKLAVVRDRIARDLHDEIGSSLSTISIYSKVVQQQLNSNGNSSQPLLNKISDSANNVQDAMNGIVWSINTKNDEWENVISRMREHAIQLSEAKDFALHFSFDDALLSVKLKMEQRKNFYLIYKEALNNIAKYAEGKNVWITLAEDGANITLTVKDDGRGFDKSEILKAGNGLHNMKARAKVINGIINISSVKELGTTITLKMPK